MSRRTFAALTLIALVAACGGDTATAPQAEVSGTYALSTINGSPMPFVLGPTQTGTLSIVSGNVIVNANGTYSVGFTVRETAGAVSTDATDTGTGTWTRTNETIRFRDDADGTITSAQFASNTLTIVADGFTFVYRK